MIPHSRPTIDDADMEAVAAVLRSGQIAQGPKTAEFERAMAAFLGAAGGVAVSSGTAALELALASLGIGAGDEVILPSYVCAAPWLAVMRVGALPRLVDIEPATFSIDAGAAAKALTPRTKAIIVPHLFGLPADLTALSSLGVSLIEDCAQTLGATQRGRPVGAVGRVTVCSFYATKLLCTGEGGMLLSNDATILAAARNLREYDQMPSVDRRAFNYKMTDLQAAMGMSQLRRLDGFLKRRAAIAAYYQETLRGTGLVLPAAPGGRTHVFYRFVVNVPHAKGGALEALMDRLAKLGIRCRRPVFRPIHHYLKADGYPVSDDAYGSALSIPIYPTLTDEEMTRTAKTLCEVVS